MPSEPHATWAHAYDAIYESSFGGRYAELTDRTLAYVRELVQPPASVIDFGAGTGRLSVPLAADGYRVTAVDPCKAMLDQLHTKAAERGVQVDVHCQGMEHALPPGQYDLALCVFTVTLYLLDGEALAAACANAASILRPGGRLLIDVPQEAVFQSFESPVPGGRRRVTIAPSASSDDLYSYEERTTILLNGQTTQARDRFTIRYWSNDDVLEALNGSGLTLVADLAERFRSAGSHYFLCEKALQPDAASSR